MFDNHYLLLVFNIILNISSILTSVFTKITGRLLSAVVDDLVCLLFVGCVAAFVIGCLSSPVDCSSISRFFGL